MDGGGRRGRNGGSGGGACCQDDALGCRWEAVQPLCLLFHLALGGDDGTERFGCMQPGRDVCKNVGETQREMDKETKGWDRLTPTSQRIILATSPTSRTSIPTSPPPIFHRFINTRNATDIQADFRLTYAGNNIYLLTSFARPSSKGTSWSSQILTRQRDFRIS